MDTVAIQNAHWWQNHSHVLVKEDYVASDEAWINKQLITINTTGTGSRTKPDVQMSEKDRNVLIVERMVQPGSVVAVQRSAGRVKTVRLPQEAAQLLYPDLIYIVQQIEVLNLPMDTQEQENFLPDANAPVETNSETTS